MCHSPVTLHPLISNLSVLLAFLEYLALKTYVCSKNPSYTHEVYDPDFQKLHSIQLYPCLNRASSYELSIDWLHVPQALGQTYPPILDNHDYSRLSRLSIQKLLQHPPCLDIHFFGPRILLSSIHQLEAPTLIFCFWQFRSLSHLTFRRYGMP